MANYIYDTFRRRELERATNTDLVGGDLYLYLVASTTGAAPYTFSHDHEFLTSIPASQRIAVSQAALANVALNSSAQLTADDLTVANGNIIPNVSTTWQALVAVLRPPGDPESPSSDRLVGYDDSITAPAPNGSGISIIFNGFVFQF